MAPRPSRGKCCEAGDLRHRPPRSGDPLTPSPGPCRDLSSGGRDWQRPTFDQLPIRHRLTGRRLLLPRGAASSCVGRVLTHTLLPAVARLLRSRFRRSLFRCGRSLEMKRGNQRRRERRPGLVRQTDRLHSETQTRHLLLQNNTEGSVRRLSPRKDGLPLEALMPRWGPRRTASSLETGVREGFRPQAVHVRCTRVVFAQSEQLQRKA